jgi:hypothetical protein
VVFVQEFDIDSNMRVDLIVGNRGPEREGNLSEMRLPSLSATVMEVELGVLSLSGCRRRTCGFMSILTTDM